MGCWNKTCGVTQFPIFYGDKTVNLILIERGFNSSTRCYSHDGGWHVIPMPIYGEYNDYGWQDDDEGQQPKYDFLAKHFSKEIVENKDEKERAAACYPPMKNGPFENNAILGDAIHGDVWRIRDWYKKGDNTLGISCFMVSRKVWDALTSSVTVTYPKKRTYTVNEIAEAITKYETYITSKREQLLAELVDGSDDDAIHRMALRSVSSLSSYGYRDFMEEFYPKEDSYSSPIRSALVKLSLSALDNGWEIPLKDLLDAGVITALDVAAFCMFDNAMYTLRKTYAPQTGEGSQCGIEPEHSALVKVMQDMIDEYNAERGE